MKKNIKLCLEEVVRRFSLYAVTSQNELACDLGVSPKGWTSILRKFGTSVILSLRVEPGFDMRKAIAFAFEPKNVVYWMVSDVIAYPKKLRCLTFGAQIS